MNAQKLKSAVNKFSAIKEQGATVEELTAAIQQDEKGYSEKEVQEILAAIANPNLQEPPKVKTPATKEEKPASSNTPMYEEWRMERKTGSDGKTVSFEKLKMNRANVKITAEEAETLNAGAESPGSVNPIMYFLSE